MENRRNQLDKDQSADNMHLKQDLFKSCPGHVSFSYKMQDNRAKNKPSQGDQDSYLVL